MEQYFGKQRIYAMTIICTIVAQNYIGSAVALMRSVREHNPEVSCHVLLIDEATRPLPMEAITWTLGSDLGLIDYIQWAFKYRLVEFATALKARYLQVLFEKTEASVVIYLDPDMIVYSKLESIRLALIKSPIVLTPHLDTDYPEDGAWPDFRLMANNGVYNLGFIALHRSEIVDTMLDWWHLKLSEFCLMEPWNGFFVDQRFMDFAPALFPVEILKDVGCNVAYWNLHSRLLSKDNNLWLVNSQPLQFFHFSGFHLDKPDRLNIYNDVGRVARELKVDTQVEIRKLLCDYAGILNESEFLQWRALPYGHALFKSGATVSDLVRCFYRLYDHRERFGDDPFSSIELEKISKGLIFRNKVKNFTQVIIGNAKQVLKRGISSGN
jgi:hypothetical protein